MAFSADTLQTAAMNHKPEYNSIVFAVKHLRRTLDRTADRVAKANAEWHDDPEDVEGHAEYHAPAAEQFPRDVRDEAIRDLVAHYLGEITLNERSA
jgi:hypothetical protein